MTKALVAAIAASLLTLVALDASAGCPYSPYVDCGNGTCCPGGDVCVGTNSCCKSSTPYLCADGTCSSSPSCGSGGGGGGGGVSCQPGYTACGSGCMPNGSVCCGTVYCAAGQVCKSPGNCGLATSASSPHGGNGGHLGGNCPGYDSSGKFSAEGTCDPQYCCPRLGLDPSGKEGYCCPLGMSCCLTGCSWDASCPDDHPAKPSASGGSGGGCAIERGVPSAVSAGASALGTIALGAIAARARRRAGRR